MHTMRIGFGYDVHPLQAGARFVLGGVEISHTHGAVGHSDADVLVHAIIDALLGAAGLRDIGQHFPDDDPALRGADSLTMLAETFNMIARKGFALGNLDATICLETPRIADYIPAMLNKLSHCMLVESGKISIKATSTEQMGFVGRGEGVSAYAVVLLYS